MNTELHESYVSERTARQLKAAGFDWHTTYVYENGELVIGAVFTTEEQRNAELSAPTLAVAQRWLREVKHRWVSVECEHAAGLQYDGLTMYLAELYDNDNGYYYNSEWDDDLKKEGKSEYATYEEALDAGIYECSILII